MEKQGLFLVIEGTDGSGKGTQFKLLEKRLIEAGYEVAIFDFPRYEEPSSYFVKEYLNGNYGTAEEVGPYAGSIFFALDRYQTAPAIRQALSEGKIVLANRFTASNMGHQGTKFYHPEQRRGYFIWLDNLEFETLKIPRPDKNIVLRVPADIAQRLVDQKATRSYTDKKRDLHEADLNHLQRAVEVYDDLCQLFPKDFTCIDCVRSGRLMDIDTVHEYIWKTVEPLLPSSGQAKKGANMPQNVKVDSNPYIKKTDAGWKLTKTGKQFLDEAVTDAEGNVYAFTDKLSPITIAAAMARLSRRADDMRITILDEFAPHEGKDEDLLKRVITAYGDDSVQQLVGQHVVVEGASNLLTKQLEWGRLAAYLEQSTRYIYYDQKDKDGNYRYFTPEYMEPDVKRQYTKTMDRIFDLYSGMVRDLTQYVRDHSSVPDDERDGAFMSATRAQACDAARPVLPVATKSTVGIFASGQAIESLIMRLLSHEMPEAHAVGRQLLKECRKVMPSFLERVDITERGVISMGYKVFTFQDVKELADEYLSSNHSMETLPVQLADYWPKNELDLVPDMLYEHSSLPLDEIREQVSKMPYEQKEKIFNAYMGERYNRRHKPGRALEKAHYSWDLVCDYGVFRDLQRHRIVDDLAWQELTPRYGYEIPELIEKADLVEKFEECFDLSLELYSYLQANNYPLEAQYATLFGHRMRWKVTYNAREAFHLHELRTTPQGHPGYRKLVLEMHQKLAEKHPMLAAAMKFVNQDEDPELTRLAAERYTQFKLSQLD